MSISVGQTPPNFSLPNQQGNTVTLADLKAKGGPTVVFFYPKNGTPGCTQQMCSFSNQYSVFKQYNASVVGISGDSEASHQSAAKQHSLPFDLLSDPKNQTRQAWGIPKFLGMLPHRVTVVLDKAGKVYHTTVAMFDADKHITEALGAVRAMAGASDTHD